MKVSEQNSLENAIRNNDVVGIFINHYEQKEKSNDKSQKKDYLNCYFI